MQEAVFFEPDDEYRKEWFRWFKVSGEDREFMFLHSTKDRFELEQLKDFAKRQGDLYRVTYDGRSGYYTIWDARV